ncbi:hypothetical protein EV673_1735 [Limnobacter thiooxidans]|nr:hypothetical protein EV673_1735 [Limnobacter thiooxidans]
MLIQLVPKAHEVTDTFRTRRCLIKRIHNGAVESETEVWFKFDQSVNPPADDDCDSYLLAVLMDAMKENRRIEIKGSVSKTLLGNLVEYQSAWNKWLPDTYHHVEVLADQVREDKPPVSGAICAFSGGVDATFSVWRHAKKLCGYRSQTINLCAIVHGFDIPLADDVAFKNATARSRNTLSDLGLNIIPIATNYREISRVNWEHAFSCALVAALGNFKNHAGTCIVGSSEPYDSLVIPWGSSPITDHLLGSGEFGVMHDGASHSRTEKVREINQWNAGKNNLRVCWQGDLKDRNCGVCEKCIRTKLNFLAVNAPVPLAFPDSDILPDLKKVQLRNDAVRAEWRQLHQIAVKNKVDEPWVYQVPVVINRKPLLERVLPKGSVRRKLVRSVVGNLRGN